MPPVALWLDDERLPPEGWVWVKTAPEAIKQLKSQSFDIVSLDHDLGENVGTGYDVLVYIEEEIHRNPDYLPPEIRVHTANPVARKKMLQAVDSIRRASGV